MPNEKYTIEQAEIDIKEIVKKLYPNLDTWSLSDVKNILEFCRDIEEKSYQWTSYTEFVQMKILRGIIDLIKTDLMKENPSDYLWHGDNPRNEFQRGVLNCVRVIDAKIHWIND